MTPVVGEIYSTGPFRMHDGHQHPGGIPVMVKSITSDGLRCIGQHMRIADGRWKPGMSASVPISALLPLEIQLDLFGQPAPALAGGAR